jgi:hypothetical protein
VKNFLIAVLDWLDAYHGEIMLAVVLSAVCWYIYAVGKAQPETYTDCVVREYQRRDTSSMDGTTREDYRAQAQLACRLTVR